MSALLHLISIYFLTISIIVCPFGINAFDKYDDGALVAFVKGPGEFKQFCARSKLTNKQSKEILAQLYGTHLGILYFMRQNWHCAAMKKEMIESDDQREKCQHSRQCLDILYEYLSTVHAGQETEKPTILRDDFEFLDFIYAIRALFWNWKIFFLPELIAENDRGQNPIDVNADNSNHFDQHGHKTEKFDEIMEKMLKKVEERAIEIKEGERLALENVMAPMPHNAMAPMPNNASTSMTNPSTLSTMENDAFFLNIVLDKTPFYNIHEAGDDEAIIHFLENYVLDKNDPIYFYYKERLGILWLLRKHWHCANAKRNEFFDQGQCDKFRQYLDLFYEYLFRLHYGLTAGKPRPIFQIGEKIMNLIYPVYSLEKIGQFYFGETENYDYEPLSYFPRKTIDRWTLYSSLKLFNEEEVDYLKDIKTFQESLVEMANEPNNERKISAGTFHALLRQQFAQKMEALAEKQSLSWAM